MNTSIIFLTTSFLIIGFSLAGIGFVIWRYYLRKAKGIERGLKMISVFIHLPPPSDDTTAQGRDVREVIKEKISQAETLYNIISGTAQAGLKSNFFGQRHIAFEIVAHEGLIYFYVNIPISIASTVEQAIVTAYPGARVEEVEDHNIFNQEGKLPGTIGGEINLRNQAAYPIATYKILERDPLEAILSVMSSLKNDEGAGYQLLIRPANSNWVSQSKRLVDQKRNNKASYSVTDLIQAPFKVPNSQESNEGQLSSNDLTNLEQEILNEIEEKTKYPAYEVEIRLIASTLNPSRSQAILQDLATAFALFERPGLNGFKFTPATKINDFVTDFIFRFFPPEKNKFILNSVELATLFHLPDYQFTPSNKVQREFSKQIDGPAHLPQNGPMLGYNIFRGIQKEIHLTPGDRRSHLYVVGQTGTGKSTLLENMMAQDIAAGNGFAFIDPHGTTAEKIIGMIPRERAEDVIYFNPADIENPLGLNLFDFESENEKDFLIQEAIGMLYKLYDPQHQGIIGPRYEHWFRNAALTLMSDPSGATFIEVPKVFVDKEYLRQKFRYITDPTVKDFWTKEMAQTSDFHKSEMLGWFVAKFGAFAQNTIMRNIIGQIKSGFSFREVMDQKKILIINLSKGQIGDLNSQLLGIILVIKFQAAAMSRANIPEQQRNDFTLYVDEFQNFSTDSFASILSEARKYHLSLTVANQYIGQLTEEIRDAVFGNVGTIVSYRCSPEDADFLEKQFSPAFEARDLVNLPNFNCAVRLLVEGLPTQPFSMTALPPMEISNPEMGQAIRQLSAAKYGSHRQTVEADIESRLRTIVPAEKTPSDQLTINRSKIPPQNASTPYLHQPISTTINVQPSVVTSPPARANIMPNSAVTSSATSTSSVVPPTASSTTPASSPIATRPIPIPSTTTINSRPVASSTLAVNEPVRHNIPSDNEQGRLPIIPPPPRPISSSLSPSNTSQHTFIKTEMQQEKKLLDTDSDQDFEEGKIFYPVVDKPIKTIQSGLSGRSKFSLIDKTGDELVPELEPKMEISTYNAKLAKTNIHLSNQSSIRSPIQSPMSEPKILDNRQSLKKIIAMLKANEVYVDEKTGKVYQAKRS